MSQGVKGSIERESARARAQCSSEIPKRIGGGYKVKPKLEISEEGK